MRLNEVKQTSNNDIMEPSLCVECGSRSFRLLQEESKYADVQKIVIKGFETSREIAIILNDDLCEHDKYSTNDFIEIIGILKTFKSNNENFQEYIEVTTIQKSNNELNNEFIEEFDYLPDNEKRNIPEYKKWAKDILSRDDSKCIICGEKRAPHVHHIFSFKEHEDYRLKIDNGIVLCRWCHHKYHDIYGKANATPVSLMKFLKEEQKRD